MTRVPDFGSEGPGKPHSTDGAPHRRRFPTVHSHDGDDSLGSGCTGPLARTAPPPNVFGPVRRL